MQSGELTQQEGHAKTERAASILIVEDEALIASYISEVLEEAGFVIAGIASTGVEALSLVAERKPDLALVDIKLAGPMDGIEVALLMHTRFNVQSIFLTAMADTETLARARGAAPVGFLEKPFRPSQVFNALQRALARMHHT